MEGDTKKCSLSLSIYISIYLSRMMGVQVQRRKGKPVIKKSLRIQVTRRKQVSKFTHPAGLAREGESAGKQSKKRGKLIKLRS